jgi:hypothetical protein
MLFFILPVREEERKLKDDVVGHKFQDHSLKSGHLGESVQIECWSKRLKSKKSNGDERRHKEHLVQENLFHGGEEMCSVRGLISLWLHFVLREPPSVVQQHKEAAPHPIHHIVDKKGHWKNEQSFL